MIEVIKWVYQLIIGKVTEKQIKFKEVHRSNINNLFDGLSPKHKMRKILNLGFKDRRKV